MNGFVSTTLIWIHVLTSSFATYLVFRIWLMHKINNATTSKDKKALIGPCSSRIRPFKVPFFPLQPRHYFLLSTNAGIRQGRFPTRMRGCIFKVKCRTYNVTKGFYSGGSWGALGVQWIVKLCVPLAASAYSPLGLCLTHLNGLPYYRERCLAFFHRITCPSMPLF